MSGKDAMHITRWGDAGPKVVLVHGSAQGSVVGGSTHFSTQQSLAGRGWQLIVPDRPGHGRTPDPGRPDDADLDGALVADLLGDGAHLVGHSFGGCVALAAAAKRPGAVRSLTIIEPAMAALAIHKPVVKRFVFGMVKALFLSFSPTTRILRFIKLVNIPPELRGGADPAELKRMGVAIRKLRLPSKDALQSELEAVKRAGIPLLVISGGWSPAFDAVCDTVAEIGNGRRLNIASPHHFPQLVSDEFNQVLAQFMEDAEARSKA
ncbi:MULTISPECIES: alpha/beta fold hydrolase [unclassified Variovorax]|uniref:alpha/beta fold hydrolase n=1 Tax=unclassified Variovorax TaxID=663243 RepID=UPI001BD32E06|nr:MULTISPECIES: alpha/beta hydrolase [unclassified Variovorax]